MTTGICNYPDCDKQTNIGNNGTHFHYCYPHGLERLQQKMQAQTKEPKTGTCFTEACTNTTGEQKFHPGQFYKYCFKCGEYNKRKYIFKDSINKMSKLKEDIENDTTFDPESYTEDIDTLNNKAREINHLMESMVGEKRKRTE